ncbi:MAG: hypothetical protein EXR50_07615 [Dehalococcoidia bacterium]|nr:hypothetical protein [Dehalococcoidia bacterium]
MQLNIQAIRPIRAALLMLSVLAFMLTTWAVAAAVTISPWPGDAAVQTVDALNGLTIIPATNNTNLSGLAYEASGSAAPGVLWAVRNGPERLYRFIWNGTNWVPDTGDWATGKQLRYPNGAIRPDTEGLTFAASPAGGIYVAAERSNNNSNVFPNCTPPPQARPAVPALSAATVSCSSMHR